MSSSIESSKKVSPSPTGQLKYSLSHESRRCCCRCLHPSTCRRTSSRRRSWPGWPSPRPSCRFCRSPGWWHSWRPSRRRWHSLCLFGARPGSWRAVGRFLALVWGSLDLSGGMGIKGGRGRMSMVSEKQYVQPRRTWHQPGGRWPLPPSRTPCPCRAARP